MIFLEIHKNIDEYRFIKTLFCRYKNIGRDLPIPFGQSGGPMAIDALSSVTNSSPITSNSSSPIELDENGDIKVTDPKLQQIQSLIHYLFNKDEEKDSSVLGDKKPVKTLEPPKQNNDTIELSSASIEMSRQERVEATVRHGNEEVRVVVERKETLRVEQNQAQAQPQSSDPLVIDLNGNGIELTDVRKDGQVQFDINGDNVKETVSWVKSTDGFLVYDRNGNGIIDNGKELFGDQNGATDGFAELAKFDENGDNIIDKNDSIYSKLNVWQDLNQNGQNGAGELSTLSDLGINAISLSSNSVRSTIAGNTVTGHSTYQTSSGTTGNAGEVYLNYFA
jgi:hypothetical protein